MPAAANAGPSGQFTRTTGALHVAASRGSTARACSSLSMATTQPRTIGAGTAPRTATKPSSRKRSIDGVVLTERRAPWRDGRVSVRQRGRGPLEIHDQRARQRLARRAWARRVDTFDVHRRAVAGRRPEPAALPSGLRIVDAAVDALGEEAHRVGDAQLDDLAVRERVERIGEVA